MQKDSRVLQKILFLKRDLGAIWIDELDLLNVWEDFKPLYDEINNPKVANTIAAFIVLCYDASSEYIEYNRDRLENKRNIMKRLAGPDCFEREVFLNAVIGDDGGIIDKTINWYIDRQIDWRWKSIISGMEFHSRANALSTGGDDMSDMKDSGGILAAADQRREKANEYLEAIRKDFISLDDALEKEDRVKITDRLKNDYSNWELYVLKRKNKKAAEEAEKIVAEEEKKKKKKLVNQNDDDQDDQPF